MIFNENDFDPCPKKFPHNNTEFAVEKLVALTVMTAIFGACGFSFIVSNFIVVTQGSWDKQKRTPSRVIAKNHFMGNDLTCIYRHIGKRYDY